MKKKINFFIVLISLTAIALGGILSMWMVDSFSRSIDNFKLNAEKSLFDAVQEMGQEKDRISRNSIPPNLKEIIAKQYAVKDKPLDFNEIITLLDTSFALDRPSRPHGNLFKQNVNKGNNDKLSPAFLAPIFRPNIHFDTQRDSLKLKNIFNKLLLSNQIKSSYTFQFKTIRTEDDRNLQENRVKASDRKILLRPFLVDPSKHLFLTVQFDYPWIYTLNSILKQLLMSIFVFCIVIGGLIYLLINLWKQYRLDAMRKSFINSLTHELRTPITTVYAALDSLRYHINNKEIELRETYYNMAFEELEHLNNMISKVLTLAESDEDNKTEIKYQSFDLGIVIQETVKHIQLVKHKNDVHLSYDLPSHVIVIDADINHIRSVLNNLLDNAIKYGSTKIWITLEEDIQQQEIVLNIHDNGLGIEDEFQKQVFKPFFRVPQGDLYSVKGFGLGLSYVKIIIEKHQGRISLKSSKGLGSKFTIVLPKNNTNND